jgi:hypothetical protein
LRCGRHRLVNEESLLDVSTSDLCWYSSNKTCWAFTVSCNFWICARKPSNSKSLCHWRLGGILIFFWVRGKMVIMENMGTNRKFQRNQG